MAWGAAPDRRAGGGAKPAGGLASVRRHGEGRRRAPHRRQPWGVATREEGEGSHVHVRIVTPVFLLIFFAAFAASLSHIKFGAIYYSFLPPPVFSNQIT